MNDDDTLNLTGEIQRRERLAYRQDLKEHVEAGREKLKTQERERLKEILRGEHEDLEYWMDQLAWHVSLHGTFNWSNSDPVSFNGELNVPKLEGRLATFVRANMLGRTIPSRRTGAWTWKVKGRQLDVVLDLFFEREEDPFFDVTARLLKLYHESRFVITDLRKSGQQKDASAIAYEDRKKINELRNIVRAERQEVREERISRHYISAVAGGERKAQRRKQARRRAARKKLQ